MSDSRRIKFKTLDNKITELSVDKNISILNLKQQIKEKLGVAVELQRLIFKGKQLKDDKNLMDYITEDDEIIHLMTRMTDQSATTGTTGSTTTTNAPQYNAPQSNVFAASSTSGGQNPLGNLLGNILNNPNTMMQMTSMIFGGEGGQGGNLNLNNILGNITAGMGNSTGSTGNTQNQQQDLNALLNNLVNPNVSGERGTSQQDQPMTESTPYPILNVPNQHISHLNGVVDSISGRNLESTSDLPTVPSLNYPLTILTAVGACLRNYHQALSRFLPYIHLTADALERESLITVPEEREKVKKLISNILSGLEDITKATGPLLPIFHGLDYGNAPGGGQLRLVATSGVQISVGDIIPNNVNTQTTEQTIPTSTTNVPSSETSGNVVNPLTTSTNFAQPSQGTTGRQNPLQQMMAEMSQPGNMEMMMNMVGGMLGGGNRGGAMNINNLLNPQTSSGQPNPLNNLLSQIMGNLGGGLEESEPSDARTYFHNLHSNSQQRKTTLVKDIPSNILPLKPETDFSSFLNDIVSLFTIQEVLDIKSVNFRGFTRLRKPIREKLNSYLSSKFNNDRTKLINELKDLILERFIIHENDEDKMVNDKFNIDDHLQKFFIHILNILLDDVCNDMKFENSLRREFLLSIGNLYEDLKSSYNTAKDGAFYFLDCNLEDLLSAIIGKDAFDVIVSIDEGFMEDFTDNAVNLYSSEKSKSVEEENKTEEPSTTNKEVEVDMDVDKIMELALLDKNRLDSYVSQNVEFSPQYSNTSLYKN